MTNRDLYSVALGIKKCNDLVNVADINFAMSLARIDSEVQSEIKIINNGKKETPERYKDYLKKKEALDLKYAIQKEDGTYQMLGEGLIVRNPNEYYKELEVLDTEYKADIDLVKSISKEFNEFLDKNCSKTITKLPKSCIPAIINVEQMKLLFPVID